MEHPSEFSALSKRASVWFQSLQNEICNALEEADGLAKFKEDKWVRAEGGGGKTRVIQNGNVIEKGGVNFSAVWGKLPAFMAAKGDTVSEKELFFASGISIVIHPKSPMVPIIHMNTRYFETTSGKHWFGGGIDLTPHYVVEEDAKFFHNQLKKVCDLFSPDYYPDFKKWADDYFYIPHRDETRGIGGIFFDNLSEIPEFTKENRFDFVRALGSCFAPTYVNLIHKNKNLPFSEKESQWQKIRRGRYVEFNLVYDRGTKFGLETNGRTESILMSLPPQAEWHYAFEPEAGSAEAKTLDFLKKGINWVGRV
ncbi:MAG: oxygen-dependent coproporphyrinogen oxidase [Bacteroidetes bacterium]|nr:oxygen-dependent coproporphyrinogen oxidase [Bacteroidota bacterium]